MLRLESTTLLLTGYLSPSTIGWKLLQYSKLPPDERKRSSEQLEWPDLDRKKPAHRVPLSEVAAQVEHGGENQRRDLHGDRHPGVTVHLPKKRDGWFDLDAGRWAEPARLEPASPEAALAERVQALEGRLAAIEEILRAEGKLP